MHRSASHLVHLYTVPFLWPQEKHKQQCCWVEDITGQCLLWQLSSRKTFFVPTLGLPTNPAVGWSSLFPASSIKFLTRRSLKSQWVYLAPHEDNSIQLLSVANNYNGLPYLFSSVWLAQFQKPDTTDINILYSDSKATMWLLYKIPVIRGFPRLFSRLMAVCCMLLPHNSYRLPQHYKRHICEPSCSCKHKFL